MALARDFRIEGRKLSPGIIWAFYLENTSLVVLLLFQWAFKLRLPWASSIPKVWVKNWDSSTKGVAFTNSHDPLWDANSPLDKLPEQQIAKYIPLCPRLTQRGSFLWLQLKHEGLCNLPMNKSAGFVVGRPCVKCILTPIVYLIAAAYSLSGPDPSASEEVLYEIIGSLQSAAALLWGKTSCLLFLNLVLLLAMILEVISH